MILAGCDPPCAKGSKNNWCAQEGTRRGFAGAGAGFVNVSKARMDCPPTKKKEDTCDLTYPKCTGKPGGRSDQGSVSVCDETDKGSGTAGLSDFPIAGFPGFGAGFGACLANFLSSVNGGDVTGAFANNVTVTGGVTPSGGGDACTGGSIGFCGFSLGGKVCTKDENGKDSTAATTRKFVEITGPSTLTFGTGAGQLKGPVIVTGGGTVAGITVKKGEILAVIDGILYKFGVETKVAAIESGTATGQEIKDVSNTTVKLTIDGTALIPAGTLIPAAA
jgi:hypothetical protein